MLADNVMDELKGKWESFDIRVVPRARPGLEEALVITGSDKVSTTLLFQTVLIDNLNTYML